MFPGFPLAQEQAWTAACAGSNPVGPHPSAKMLPILEDKPADKISILGKMGKEKNLGGILRWRKNRQH